MGAHASAANRRSLRTALALSLVAALAATLALPATASWSVRGHAAPSTPRSAASDPAAMYAFVASAVGPAVAVRFDRSAFQYDDCEMAATQGSPCDPAGLASSTVIDGRAGRTLLLVSCDGPFGTWKGTLIEGGFQQTRHVTGATLLDVAFGAFPIDFTVGGSGALRTTTGLTNGILDVTAAGSGEPSGPFPYAYSYLITVTPTQLSLVAFDPSGFSNPLTDQFPKMTIESLPKGACG